MIIIDQIEKIPPLSGPIALSIGTYDGVHLGHQYLFQELKKRGTAAVLTFSNHPAEILHGKAPPLIDTIEQKLRRLEAQGIDLAIVIPFTEELSSLSYDAFLQKLREKLPFTHLIVGEGDSFGHGAQGTEKNIREFASQQGFQAVYLPKFTFEGETISSRKIRELISTGNFEQAFRLLGRKAW